MPLKTGTFFDTVRVFKKLINNSLRGYGTLKYDDVHKNFIFLEIQDLRPLRTSQNPFETILPNFPLDECEI